MRDTHQHPIEKPITLTCDITSNEFQTDELQLTIDCNVIWDGVNEAPYLDILTYSWAGEGHMYGGMNPALDRLVAGIANMQLDSATMERMTYEEPEFAPLRHRAFGERQAEVIQFRRSVL